MSVGSPSISPDGKTLLLTAQDPLTAEDRRRRRDRDDAVGVDETFRWSRLWTFDIATGKEARLTVGQFVVSDPQWSPDSKKVAYVTRPVGFDARYVRATRDHSRILIRVPKDADKDRGELRPDLCCPRFFLIGRQNRRESM